MQCSEAELDLSRIFDDDCGDAVTRALGEHLHACADCRELTANLLLVDAMCRVARGLWGIEKTSQVLET